MTDPVTGVVVMRVDGENMEPIGSRSEARCGFLNPILYGNALRGAFRDTTVGNNGAHAAAPAWDAWTGRGSPIGQQLRRALSGAAHAKGAGG